jgi:hypothetical protein
MEQGLQHDERGGAPAWRWTARLSRLRGKILSRSWLRVLLDRRVIAVASVVGFAAAVTVLVFVVHDKSLDDEWSVPIDDSYIHFQYARSIAEGHPFSYHRGDPYTTGETSPAYALLLSVPYLLGLRGMQMVPVVVVLGGLFLAASMLLLLRIGAQLGNARGGIAAAVLWGVFGFGWYCLYSGMETGFYVTLILVALSLFIDWHTEELRVPRWPLLLTAALLPLARPDAIAVLGAMVTVAGIRIWRARGAPRRALILGAWLATFVPAVAYVVANRCLTGCSSTAGMVSKSLLNVPYKKTYQLVIEGISHFFDAVQGYIAGGEAIYLPVAVGTAGIIAVVGLGARELARREVGPGVLIAAWTVLALAAASMHHIRIAGWMRYYLPALVLVVFGAGFAAACVADHLRRRWLLPAFVVGLVVVQGRGTVEWMKRYEKDLTTVHEKQAAAARFVADLPEDARVLVCDAGALAYLSGHWTFDIVGLTSQVRHNYFRAGAGSRFELFEGLPADRRPSHVATYDFCLWPGARGKPIRKFRDMIVARVVEAGARTGHGPGVHVDGWRVVDRVDVADLESEAAHAYRVVRAKDIKENIVRRGVSGEKKGVVDGGRLVRKYETFKVRARAGRPTKLVVRLGPTRNDDLVVTFNGAEVRAPVAKDKGFVETALDIPQRVVRRESSVRVRTAGRTHYFSFHYFVMQRTR